MFENSYQPPNYPFKDKLAELFSPPLYAPFYKQKETLILVLFSHQYEIHASSFPACLTFIVCETSKSYCLASLAHSRTPSAVQVSRLDPRHKNLKE